MLTRNLKKNLILAIKEVSNKTANNSLEKTQNKCCFYYCDFHKN